MAELVVAHPELAGRRPLVPRRVAQRARQERPLERRHAVGERPSQRLARRDLDRQLRGLDRAVAVADVEPLDDVAQLADVARPRVAGEGGEGRLGEAGRAEVGQLLVEPRDEVLDELGLTPRWRLRVPVVAAGREAALNRAVRTGQCVPPAPTR